MANVEEIELPERKSIHDNEGYDEDYEDYDEETSFIKKDDLQSRLDKLRRETSTSKKFDPYGGQPRRKETPFLVREID